MATMVDQIQVHEGLRLKAYQCSEGRWTIGYGRNVQDVGISKAEAMMLLQNDLARVHREAKENFAWYGKLSDNRQRVIQDMLFNMGLVKFKKFRNTIAAIAAGNYKAAATEMLDSIWSRQVGNRAKRLAYMMERDASFEAALKVYP